jgi:hypothetical protein
VTYNKTVTLIGRISTAVTLPTIPISWSRFPGNELALNFHFKCWQSLCVCARVIQASTRWKDSTWQPSALFNRQKTMALIWEATSLFLTLLSCRWSS